MTNQQPAIKPPSPYAMGGIALVFVLLFAVMSSYYTINPEEAGVLLRFGKYVDTTGPGLHFKLPLGIDRVIKVQYTTIRKAEFGYRTLRAGINTSYSKEGYQYESHMLTGDLNVAEVSWSVQYKVSDPYKFLFKLRNVEKTIRDITESTMRMVVGDHSVTDMITSGRSIAADKVKVIIQQTFNEYDFGVTVTNVILKDVDPPKKVRASFNMVNEAIQEQDQLINEGWQQYNKVIPMAKGKAKKVVQEAEGYAIERVNNAYGETNRFLEIYKAYKNAPKITAQRLYLENISSTFEKVDKLYVVDPQVKTIVPYLQMNPGVVGGK